MAALAVGAKAPDFALKTVDGTRFCLSEELARGAVVLAFFKVSCPTCQYAFPFLERLHRAYGGRTREGKVQGRKPNSDGDAGAALKGPSSTNPPSIGASSAGASSTGRSSIGASTGVGLPAIVSLIGVSQNDANDTAAFIKEFGITFPVLLDDTRSYPASNAYGLTNVPSIFYV